MIKYQGWICLITLQNENARQNYGACPFQTLDGRQHKVMIAGERNTHLVGPVTIPASWCSGHANTSRVEGFLSDPGTEGEVWSSKHKYDWNSKLTQRRNPWGRSSAKGAPWKVRKWRCVCQNVDKSQDAEGVSRRISWSSRRVEPSVLPASARVKWINRWDHR